MDIEYLAGPHDPNGESMITARSDRRRALGLMVGLLGMGAAAMIGAPQSGAVSMRYRQSCGGRAEYDKCLKDSHAELQACGAGDHACVCKARTAIEKCYEQCPAFEKTDKKKENHDEKVEACECAES
ncbi:hypothetical protein [Nocardia sp. NPDC051570]|uniref:hypothetical protein n=1 Tax=Nocardia sp. NPDC051570 TaxID=3364324 RepID=UPI00379C0FD8